MSSMIRYDESKAWEGASPAELLKITRLPLKAALHAARDSLTPGSSAIL